MSATTLLIGFSGEIIWPIGQIQLLVKIGDEEHSASAWMNFVVVRSPSPYNGIIGRPGVRKLQAVPLTAHGMLKILIEEGVITLKSSKLVPLECAIVSGPKGTPSATKPIMEERVKVAINPEYPKQIKPADMTGVPRHIAEHRLNVREGCSLVRQKKRGQAADRNQAIQEEVGKLVADLNKACPKDGYPLPEIDWKVESLCGFPFKCFLDAYKGYHQIQMAKEIRKNPAKKKFITTRIFCYTKMLFGLRNAGETYQLLVDKVFHKQIDRNMEVYVDDLVIKSRTKVDVGDIRREHLKTQGEINHETNPKKLPLGWKKECLRIQSHSKGLKYSPDKVELVLSSLPMNAKGNLSRPEVAGRLQKWSIELGEYAIHYRPSVLVKGQILADFIVERLEEDSPDTPMEEKEELPEPWILFTDGSSCTDGSGAGLILTNPEGIEFTYALRFRFDATNNKAEYKALIAGLRIAKQIGVKNLQANVDSRLVANQVNGMYVAKEADMIRYLEKVKALTGGFKAFTIKQIPRSENKKADALSKIASTSFAHLKEGTLMTPIYKYLVEETLPADMKKAMAIRRKSWRFVVINVILYKKSFLGPWLRFGLPGEIISDNGKQFRDDPFKDWCEKLCINQHFASVKHPQTNGLVERANRSLGEGIKARLEARSKNWMEELSHVLWAHRTMIKSSNEDTPFSLTYGTEAVIPAEIGMPTIRTAEVDQVQNNEALQINLDLLEERREEAAIREARRDLVYRNNDASRAEDTGKLGPKWEGPYEVTEALGKGAYKLRDRDGKHLPRTWNISNLKKCYVHKM
ncbi:reverse transcriptase domain-containing protein [Tanacetum coccineum]|uniref:Reverse transcriptase domain-containing protein n=1 Tax=Tanacetum coccineum TaxID=301880 RepID=A0ABQ4YYE9_9ASTR